MEDVEVKTKSGRARKLSDKAVQSAVLKDKADPRDGLADGMQCVDKQGIHETTCDTIPKSIQLRFAGNCQKLKIKLSS